MKQLPVLIVLSCILLTLSACINPYSTHSRSDFFERFIKPKFPTEYYIYPGQFTQEEIQTIHLGYQNWEPIIQRLTGTAFRFRFMGYAAYPFNSEDAVHVVLRSSLEGQIVGRAHLLGSPGYTPTSGGDIVISNDKSFHTADQVHAWGLRLIFSNCLEAVVTHEVGHLMGLNHSNSSDDIMYPNETFTNCSTRKPSANDERALGLLYIRYLSNFDFTKNFDSSDFENLIYSQ